MSKVTIVMEFVDVDAIAGTKIQAIRQLIKQIATTTNHPGYLTIKLLIITPPNKNTLQHQLYHFS